jgi:hypothetical protein
MTLGEYAIARDYGQDFLDLYVIPMGSAVWSTPPEAHAPVPRPHADALLVQPRLPRHENTSSSGGPCRWSAAVCAQNHPALPGPHPPQQPRSPESSADAQGVKIYPKDGPPETFDKVILATHAPTSLCPARRSHTAGAGTPLPPFKYQPNLATLHTDERFMPKTRRCWAAWNYRVKVEAGGRINPSTHYWMNRLQGVSEKTNYFVSINGAEDIDPAKVIQRIRLRAPALRPARHRRAKAPPRAESNLPRPDHLLQRRLVPLRLPRGRLHVCGGNVRIVARRESMGPATLVTGRRQLWSCAERPPNPRP